MEKVKRATGCNITARDLEKNPRSCRIIDYGAVAGGDVLENTRAINEAISDMAKAGGGTVVIPKGEYGCYTVRLCSNVNIFFEKGAILRAARYGSSFSLLPLR